LTLATEAALALETEATDATDAAETDARETEAAAAAAELDEIIDWTEATEAAETELTLSTDADATLATELTEATDWTLALEAAGLMPKRAGDWHCRLTQTRPAAQVASSPGATLYVVAQVPPLAMPPVLDEGEKQAFHMQNEPPRPVEAWQSLLLLHE